MNRNRRDSGKAKKNHFANVISGPLGKRMLKIRTNDRFGGVPTMVAIPPMEALYAKPRKMPLE